MPQLGGHQDGILKIDLEPMRIDDHVLEGSSGELRVHALGKQFPRQFAPVRDNRGFVEFCDAARKHSVFANVGHLNRVLFGAVFHERDAPRLLPGRSVLGKVDACRPESKNVASVIVVVGWFARLIGRQAVRGVKNSVVALNVDRRDLRERIDTALVINIGGVHEILPIVPARAAGANRDNEDDGEAEPGNARHRNAGRTWHLHGSSQSVKAPPSCGGVSSEFWESRSREPYHPAARRRRR